MDFVNNMRAFISVFILLSFFILSAQTSDNISVKLKDFHTTEITDAVSAKDNHFFISADQSGKILLYNSEDFTFKKTLRKSTGIPIEKLKLIRNDSLVVFTQKFAFSDGKTDSIISLRLFDNKIVYKSLLKGNLFIEQQDDVIMTCSHNGYINVLEVLDTNFKQITKTFPLHSVKLAAFEPDNQLIAYVNEIGLLQKSIVIASPKTGKNILDIEIPETAHILHLFFDPKTSDLFAISVNDNDNKLNAYNLSNNTTFDKPEFVTDFDFGKFVNISTINKEDSYFVSITSNSNFPHYPLLLSKSDKGFLAEYIKYPDGVNNSTFLNTSNEVVFFETTNKDFSIIKNFNVYNLKEKTKSKSYPNISTNPYAGTFLPDNNWMVIGQELNNKTIVTSYEYQLKLYESGTLSNRFSKLDYANYLEAKHKTKEFASSSFMLDKINGIHPFYGYKIKSEYDNDYAFYKYDIINDSVTKIADEQPEHKTIIDYNNHQNLLLISQQLYTNNGYTDPQEFVLIKDNNPTPLKETYKFGKFSINGEYLLTITDKNAIKVYNTSTLKPVYEETLTDGSYSTFNMDDTNFAVSIKHSSIDFNKCNKETIVIAQDTIAKTFSSQKIECSLIQDLSYVNEKIAIIMEDFGLVLNNETYQFPLSEFPEYVSLNKDGSKLMVSFNNGKITVYDTNDFKALGTTIHPDKDSHIFLSSEGYYFSNINPEDYIIANKNNQTVALSDVETEFFKPKEVLSVFGEPNKSYVKTLEKALQLKSKNRFTTTIDKDLDTDTVREDSTLPANLYVLSIGVSDYKQSDFNLTFADKDALDIARIYGALDAKTKASYNNKFHGKKYNLINSTQSSSSSLNKYNEQFTSVSNLRCVSTDAKIWLENDYGNYYLWNFDKKTTEAIKMPSDFEETSYSTSKLIYINPDHLGFYMKSDDEIYSYLFTENTFQNFTLPFEYLNSDSVVPISDRKWLQFETKNEDLSTLAKISIAKNNASKIEQEFLINLDNYYTKNNQNETVLEIENEDYGYSFKATSSNGKHVIYNSYNNNLYHINLDEKEPIPYKINLREPIDKYSEVYISEDGQSFSVVSKSAENYKYKIKVFDISGNLKNTITLKDDEQLNLKALTCFNNTPLWIKASEPLIEEEFIDSNKLISTYKPYSFNKTIVKHLTNKEANSDAIKQELSSFFETAKPNDQVMVFLAGHGVLDKDLNYYFAPHDMDFNNVSSHGISLNIIIENLKKSPSENKLLLMDSCHSGNTLDMENSEIVTVDDSKDPNKRGSKARRTSKQAIFKVSDVVSTLFEDFLSTSGITILSASSGEDVAYENKNIGNGAFTSAYIKTLKEELKGNSFAIDEANLNKSITLNNENIENLLKEVMIITNGKQVPDLREISKDAVLKMW